MLAVRAGPRLWRVAIAPGGPVGAGDLCGEVACVRFAGVYRPLSSEIELSSHLQRMMHVGGGPCIVAPTQC